MSRIAVSVPMRHPIGVHTEMSVYCSGTKIETWWTVTVTDARNYASAQGGTPEEAWASLMEVEE